MHRSKSSKKRSKVSAGLLRLWEMLLSRKNLICSEKPAGYYLICAHCLKRYLAIWLRNFICLIYLSTHFQTSPHPSNQPRALRNKSWSLCIVWTCSYWTASSKITWCCFRRFRITWVGLLLIWSLKTMYREARSSGMNSKSASWCKLQARACKSTNNKLWIRLDEF